MKPVEIPPVGAICARMVPFHVGYDSELVKPGVTKFFYNFRTFADGSPKLFPEECNLHGSCGLLQAQVKWVYWISISVEEAGEDEEFEVTLVFGASPFFTVKIKSGFKNAVKLEDPVKIIGLEQWGVEVVVPEDDQRAPRYGRVYLHGPIAVACAS